MTLPTRPKMMRASRRAALRKVDLNKLLLAMMPAHKRKRPHGHPAHGTTPKRMALPKHRPQF